MTPELEEFLRVEMGYSISKIRELEKCWQAAFLAGRERQREELRKAMKEFDETLELIEEAHFISKENLDNQRYYSWEKMWEDMKVNWERTKANIRGGEE